MAKYPHCDELVLHAPGNCTYCDEYPEEQKLREYLKVNFTGDSDEDKIKCPSERRRSLEVINKWPGNTPRPRK